MNQPRRTAAEMYPLLELFDQRTETVEAFCASHDVSQAQLYYLRRKYQQQKASSQGDAFVEITSPAMGPAAPVEDIVVGLFRLGEVHLPSVGF